MPTLQALTLLDNALLKLRRTDAAEPEALPLAQPSMGPMTPNAAVAAARGIGATLVVARALTPMLACTLGAGTSGREEAMRVVQTMSRDACAMSTDALFLFDALFKFHQEGGDTRCA